MVGASCKPNISFQHTTADYLMAKHIPGRIHAHADFSLCLYSLAFTPLKWSVSSEWQSVKSPGLEWHSPALQHQPVMHHWSCLAHSFCGPAHISEQRKGLSVLSCWNSWQALTSKKRGVKWIQVCHSKLTTAISTFSTRLTSKTNNNHKMIQVLLTGASKMVNRVFFVSKCALPTSTVLPCKPHHWN
jgi:hypothetical protein